MQQPYQFTAEDGDIILRTPESKLFRVHKNILSIASSVFRDMMTVPRPPSDSTGGGECEPPVVDVYDSADDLEVLLRMIYPVAFPPITDLDALSKVFVILDKYGAEGLQERLKPLLISPAFLATDPMRVYAIACRWGFQTEAAVAAPHASAINISTITRMDDIKYISAPDYHRIVLLSQERREIGRREILNKPATCRYCPPTFYDNFRPKLVERLFVGDEMFRDIGTCMVVCFAVAKETESEYAMASCAHGRSHLEEFVVSLAKSLQIIPNSQNATMSLAPYISRGTALSNNNPQQLTQGEGIPVSLVASFFLTIALSIGVITIFVFLCRFILSIFT